MNKEEVAVLVFLLILAVVATFKMILIKDEVGKLTNKPETQKVYEKH